MLSYLGYKDGRIYAVNYTDVFAESILFVTESNSLQGRSERELFKVLQSKLQAKGDLMLCVKGLWCSFGATCQDVRAVFTTDIPPGDQNNCDWTVWVACVKTH